MIAYKKWDRVVEKNMEGFLMNIKILFVMIEVITFLKSRTFFEFNKLIFKFSYGRKLEVSRASQLCLHFELA